MTKITQAQMRRIFVLARERGLDNDLLHAHALTMLGKESLKTLTVSEAVRLIDSLDGKQQGNRITKRQMQYIEVLCISLGWTDDTGKVDAKVLNAFIEKQYGISRLPWMSVKQASKLIEGLKKLQEKDKKKGAKQYEENTY